MSTMSTKKTYEQIYRSIYKNSIYVYIKNVGIYTRTRVRA